MHRFFLLSFFAVSLVSFSYTSHPAFPAVVATDTTGVAEAMTKGTLQRFELSTAALYDSLNLAAFGLSDEIFRLAMIGYQNLRSRGELNEKEVLTIIDFTKPGTEKRFFTLDLKTKEVLYNSLVAHGRNSGGNRATSFSDKPRSNQSSLGFYVTGDTYFGSNGYSLRLKGRDPRYNSNLARRSVVIHGADYVSDDWIVKYGRLGRSFGCPALPEKIAREVIDAIKGGTAIFAFFPDPEYLASSPNLDLDRLLMVLSRVGGSGQVTAIAE